MITAYQWHQLVCAACGAVTRAPWPAGVPSGTYGPRVQATVALCTGSSRLSKHTTQQMMDDVFGVPMRVGTVSQLWNRPRPRCSRGLFQLVESMMTVVATLKQQQRNVLAYLTEACEAVLWGEAAPSLLPTIDQKEAERETAA